MEEGVPGVPDPKVVDVVKAGEGDVGGGERPCLSPLLLGPEGFSID